MRPGLHRADPLANGPAGFRAPGPSQIPPTVANEEEEAVEEDIPSPKGCTLKTAGLSEDE